ncbi:MAG: putative sulfate exporter family transporter [Longimicrobiales bacterium]|nr:putative sulfate exporter family transporter [Longimicrobiales bacterium]
MTRSDPGRSLAAALPGLALVAALAVGATAMSGWVGEGLLGYTTSPLSPILLAVLSGLLIRNTVGLDGAFAPGIAWTAGPLLRVSIALLGIRLSVGALATLGVIALPIVVGCIVAALGAIGAITRLVNVPPRLGSLIAAGTSICGITAVVALAPVIEARDDETSYAVATVALFGMIALFSYPFLAHVLFDDATRAGLFLGTSIHDTSQVVGAALAYSQQFGAPEAVETAVVTKLVRNVGIIAVIPLISYLHASRSDDSSRPAPAVPGFILAFVAMALLRTAGDLAAAAGLLPVAGWDRAVAWTQWAAAGGLLVAMAAVGLGTRVDGLLGLGARPLAVGLTAALTVGGVSIVLIELLGIVHVL